MAESGEKTEEASPQKVREAREKGQVSKSQDFVSAIVFAGAFAVLAGSLTIVTSEMSGFIISSMKAISRTDLDLAAKEILNQGLKTWVLVSLPVLATAFVLGLVGNYMQVGFLFTTDPLIPKLDKLNPIQGMKQLFSVKRFVEVLKQIVKFSMVSFVVYHAVKNALPNIILMQRLDMFSSLGIVGSIITDICLRVSALFLVVAGADYFWQRHVFKKSLMMTKQEVKTEYKQSEGDPELKGERKRLAQELIMHGSQQRVKNADAVVTNPAHIAVAIQYDKERKIAPMVIAKGLRKNAAIIKQIARENNIPILRNVPLAQALNKLNLEEEIPEELYEAVAEVLNFVYELKNKK
jgi:flagellar biosynthesis protein FlhB